MGLYRISNSKTQLELSKFNRIELRIPVNITAIILDLQFHHDTGGIRFEFDSVNLDEHNRSVTFNSMLACLCV